MTGAILNARTAEKWFLWGSGLMTEYIKAIANIVSIVFVTYGIFVLHKWKKVADKLDALMEETKDG